jgi:hypothetical protein
MNVFSRRLILSTGLSTASCLFTWTASAQSAIGGLRQQQRDDYARVFQSSGATSRELSVLSDIQNNRLSMPQGMKNFEDFIAESPAISALTAGITPQLGMLKFWHDISLEATALDHTTVSQPAPPEYAEQFGPTRSSRALAIVHIAIFEAVNAIHQKYQSYKGIQSTIFTDINLPSNQVSPATASVDRAIIEAAHDTLAALYPNKKSMFVNARTITLPRVGDPEPAQQLGEKIGRSAAAAILLIRQSDKSDMPDLTSDDFGSADPLDWQQDPVSKLHPALGGNWWRVTPFVIASGDAHRPSPPPKAGDPDFIKWFKDVRSFGGDPNAPTEAPRWPTKTDRKGHQTTTPFDDTNESFKGIFWAYDGTPAMCAPPRLYNMVATSIALKERPITAVYEFARMLALINIAMADAGIAAWEAKYHYAYARPVTAIRNMSADGTPEGQRDPNWTPLGAPVTNGRMGERNLTPPFPAYPSGHATFGGALFETLRIILKRDSDPNPFDGVEFDFVSDEYNGGNRHPGDPMPRPMVVRHFMNFSAAEEENARSRIWLGIHWQFDATSGIAQGKAVAQDVCNGILALI